MLNALPGSVNSRSGFRIARDLAAGALPQFGARPTDFAI